MFDINANQPRDWEVFLKENVPTPGAPCTYAVLDCSIRNFKTQNSHFTSGAVEKPWRHEKGTFFHQYIMQ